MKSYLRISHILAVVGLLLAIQAAFYPVKDAYAAGASYYVAKNGSNSNPGTQAQPWLTISKAASTLMAGDIVYVKAGTYNESVRPSRSGSDGAWITYKNFGTDKVIIDGTGLATSGYGVFGLYGVHHIIVDGFEVRNSGDFAGVYVGTYSAGATGNIILRNLIVHDTWNSGILVNSSWSFPITQKMTNITIDNCEVYNSNIGGSNEGISLIGIDTFEIKNSRVHDVQGHQNYLNDKEGIDCKEGSSNGSIHDSEVYNTKLGIYVGGSSTAESNISIYGNKLHNNYGNGIGIGSEQSGQPTTAMSIFNNLIYNNGDSGFTVLDYSFTTSFSLINNTFYKNGTDREIYLTASPTYSNSIIRNNIIYGAPNSVLIWDAGYPNGITIDHNLFYSTTYNAATKYGTSYQRADPLFVTAGSNFQLQSSSLARDGGSATSAPATDYAGTSRPQGTGFDIGAYEYSVASTPPSVSTLTATNINPSLATLNGSLTGLGSASSATATFQYGLSSAYGSSIAGVPSTLSGPGAFTATINGLTPGTTYHYRAVSAGAGTGYGGDQTFTTTLSSSIWDVNGDGAVNILDLISIGQHWGETGTPGWIPQDVNHDGIVNSLDNIAVGQHWTG